MKTYIALFRGINVGGNSVLPMRDLVAALEGAGGRDVKTYIQSGNAVFRSGETGAALLPGKVRASLAKSHGFEPGVLVIALEDWERMIAANPFPETEPKTLHLYFLAATPETPDPDVFESLRGDRERFAFGEGVFYLYAPDGVGRSRLAARAERLLGVPATARNWRTVSRLTALARACDRERAR